MLAPGPSLMHGLRRIHEIIQNISIRADPLCRAGYNEKGSKSLGRGRHRVRIGRLHAGRHSNRMTDLARTQPEQFFADRFNVTPGLMERLLGGSLVGRVDDADIYLEYRVNEELVLEEGVVKKASRHVSQGAGVRAQADDADRLRPHRRHLARQPRGGRAPGPRHRRSRRRARGTLAVAGRGRPHDLYTLVEPPIVTALERKLELLRQVDAAARAADPRVKQVIASLVERRGRGAASPPPSGWTVGDVRPLTRLNVTVIAEDNGKREIGSCGGGGRVPFDFFLEDERWTRFAAEAARQADAQAARGGGAGRHDDRRARAGLAGHPAARGDRPRPRGRLQPQGRRRPSPGASARRSPPSW